MKRKILCLSVIAIMLAILAAGTIAYFTAEGRARNVITNGSVEIELKEWADENKTEPFKNLEGVMPNTTVTKIAEIKNIGKSDAWIRVKIQKSIELKYEGNPDTDLVELNLNDTDWITDGEYYYYKNALKPGETTTPIFTSVTFKAAMGNEYQGAKATVDIYAQAVQTANNPATDGDVKTVKGWPASEPAETTKGE